MLDSGPVAEKHVPSFYLLTISMEGGMSIEGKSVLGLGTVSIDGLGPIIFLMDFKYYASIVIWEDIETVASVRI